MIYGTPTICLLWTLQIANLPIKDKVFVTQALRQTMVQIIQNIRLYFSKLTLILMCQYNHVYCYDSSFNINLCFSFFRLSSRKSLHPIYVFCYPKYILMQNTLTLCFHFFFLLYEWKIRHVLTSHVAIFCIQTFIKWPFILKY